MSNQASVHGVQGNGPGLDFSGQHLTVPWPRRAGSWGYDLLKTCAYPRVACVIYVHTDHHTNVYIYISIHGQNDTLHMEPRLVKHNCIIQYLFSHFCSFLPLKHEGATLHLLERTRRASIN